VRKRVIDDCHHSWIAFLICPVEPFEGLVGIATKGIDRRDLKRHVVAVTGNQGVQGRVRGHTRALERLRADFSGESKAKIFEELKPFVSGGTGLPRQEEAAELLAMPIDTLRSHLSRMRARYRALLREEVARTIGLADDVDEELHHLSQVLIAGS
jgi:hypothetical protein